MNEKFVEARDEIEYAQEDAETVYFNESHDAAKEAVSACLDLFSRISSQLDESERGIVHARLQGLLEMGLLLVAFCCWIPCFVLVWAV